MAAFESKTFSKQNVMVYVVAVVGAVDEAEVLAVPKVCSNEVGIVPNLERDDGTVVSASHFCFRAP